MPIKRTLSLQSFAVWLAVATGIITLIWQLGDRYITPKTEAIRALENRVLTLEIKTTYLHGTFDMPKN